jgi:hypothetical protein
MKGGASNARAITGKDLFLRPLVEGCVKAGCHLSAVARYKLQPQLGDVAPHSDVIAPSKLNMTSFT